MSVVTITEAARLTGKSTQTLYRHIKAGRLSRRSDKMIDAAELVRVYGSINNNVTISHAEPITPISRHDTDHVKWMERKIDKLENDLKELKSESLAREARLMALLENKTSSGEGTGGLFSKLFK